MNHAWSTLIVLCWIIWAGYWLVTSFNVKANQWREPFGSQFIHRLPLLCVFVLLDPRIIPPKILAPELFVRTNFIEALAFLMTAIGVAFAMWARRCLGQNWSAIVTVKVGHSLIRTGPYQFVRHPIYTGMLLAIAGTALDVDRWSAIIAFVVAFVSLTIKSRIEEARMLQTFPEYQEYRQHSKALIPFIY